MAGPSSAIPLMTVVYGAEQAHANAYAADTTDRKIRHAHPKVSLDDLKDVGDHERLAILEKITVCRDKLKTILGELQEEQRNLPNIAHMPMTQQKCEANLQVKIPALQAEVAQDTGLIDFLTLALAEFLKA